MGKSCVQYTLQIRASIESVFARLTDHESMGDWPGVSSAKLLVQGQPKNGMGAVRVLRARGLSIHEKVVHFDPPNRYDYQIIKGLPVRHLGSVRLTQEGELVTVHWEVKMSSKIPFVAQLIGKMLKDGLPAALEHVKNECESNS